MDEIKEEYLDSCPQFRGHAMIEGYKLDKMRHCYQIMTKTSHRYAGEISAMCKTRDTLRKKGYAYAVTAQVCSDDRFFRLWVEGVEAKEANDDND